jgi:type IV pilus assembly protein PilW
MKPYMQSRNSTLTRGCRSDARTLQSGLTLVELMISITLGMLVVASAMTLLLSSKSSYVTEDDTSRVLDTGRFALEAITRSIRQAGFENLDDDGAPIVAPDIAVSNIYGYDDRTFTNSFNVSGSPPRPTPIVTASGSNPNDVLELRFFGVSKTTPVGIVADKSIVDCGGFPIAGVSDPTQADQGRGWSIFYVKVLDLAAGEAELRCGYKDPSGTFNSMPIASGIESFQVLYGLVTDSNPDGIPNRFVTASTLRALDPSYGTSATSVWKKVVAVKISLLIRGGSVQRADVANTVFDMFGSVYSNSSSSSSDFGSKLSEASMPVAQRSRTRKMFTTLVQLRNSAKGGNVKALP